MVAATCDRYRLRLACCLRWPAKRCLSGNALAQRGKQESEGRIGLVRNVC